MMTQLVKTLISRLPFLFILAAPVFWAGAFLLSWTTYGELAAFSVYPLYALAISAMCVFLLVLLVRSRGGCGSVLLVALFYETLFFGVTLWAISIIAFLAIFGYDWPIYTSLARAFVASAAGVSLVAVTAVYLAWRYGLLDERVRAFPWRRETGGRVK